MEHLLGSRHCPGWIDNDGQTRYRFCLAINEYVSVLLERHTNNNSAGR